LPVLASRYFTQSLDPDIFLMLSPLDMNRRLVNSDLTVVENWLSEFESN
jgi:hypothetical protein